MPVTGMILQFVFWMLVALIGVVMLVPYIVVLFILYRWLKFKVDAVIHEVVGGSFMGDVKKAKEIVGVPDENGVRQTLLKLDGKYKGRSQIPLPPSAAYIPFRSLFGVRKRVNLLFVNGTFTPLQIAENSAPELVAATVDFPKISREWDLARSTNTLLHQGSKSFLDKYGQLLAVGFPMMMHFILIIVIVAMLKSGGGGGGMPQLIG